MTKLLDELTRHDNKLQPKFCVDFEKLVNQTVQAMSYQIKGNQNKKIV